MTDIVDNLDKMSMQQLIETILAGINSGYVNLNEFIECLNDEGIDTKDLIKQQPEAPAVEYEYANWVYPPDSYADIVLYILNASENLPIVPIAVLPYQTKKCKKTYDNKDELILKEVCDNIVDEDLKSHIKDGINFKYGKKWTVLCYYLNEEGQLSDDLHHLPYQKFLLLCTKYNIEGFNKIYAKSPINSDSVITDIEKNHQEIKCNKSDWKYYLRFVVPYGKGLGWGEETVDLYTAICRGVYKNQCESKINTDESIGVFNGLQSQKPFRSRRVKVENNQIVQRGDEYQGSYMYIPGTVLGDQKNANDILNRVNKVDECMDKKTQQEFGKLQYGAAKHNIYLTGYRFGDNKFLTYIFDEKNKKWLQDRKRKPKGEWKSIQSLRNLIDKKRKQRISPSKSGFVSFASLQHLELPRQKFNYNKDLQLNPVPIHAFGYHKKAIKKFPVDRLYGQLYALPQGPSAYFKGKHQGVSSTFSEKFSKQHGLWNPKGRYVNTSAPLTQYQYGRKKKKKQNKCKRKHKSCFGKSVQPNEYANNVFNSYTGRYQGGIANNKYGYKGTQGPYGGNTGVVGFPARSNQTIQQRLIPEAKYYY